MKVLEYINYLLPTTIKVCCERNLKPCIIFACLSQGALETGWCKSNLMVENNAPFGVKYTGKGKYYEANTIEYVNGVKQYIRCKFASYDTLEDGVNAYINLITTGRYKDTLKCDYVKEVITVLKNNGYATDPNYINSVMGVYDTIVKVLR